MLPVELVHAARKIAGMPAVDERPNAYDSRRAHRTRRFDKPAGRLASVSRDLDHRPWHEIRLDRPARSAAVARRARQQLLLGIAAVGTFAEFFADKIAWVDSAWDAIHGFIRPLGGALLSLAIVDSADPAWQVGSFLLGGGAALIAHAGKAGARHPGQCQPRALLQYHRLDRRRCGDRRAAGVGDRQPIAAAIIALGLVLLSLWLVITARRALARFIDRVKPPRQPLA
jgi:hypothetical protein